MMTNTCCMHVTTRTLNDGVGFVAVAVVVGTLVTHDALAIVSGPATDTPRSQAPPMLYDDWL